MDYAYSDTPVEADRLLTTPSPEATSATMAGDRGSMHASMHRRTIERIQQYANVGAHGLALASLLVVYWWVSTLGGLSWKAGAAKQVFNWHPLLMVATFSFMTVASLSFRLPRRCDNRDLSKLVHGISWLVAALAATVGLIAVFASHNDAASGYVANLYSLHSWIGILVILLYVAQFLIAVRAFGGPFASLAWSPPWKALLLQFHVVLGPLIYVLTATTILLGVQEKEGFVGCGYHVDSVDWMPIQHLGKIPPACLVSHLLGFLVLATTLLTGLALADLQRPARAP